MAKTTTLARSIEARSPALAGWVLRNELVLFFLCTFLFSWTIYGALAIRSPSSETTYSRILLIAGFGPSLSALLLWSLTRPTPGKKIPLPHWLLLVPVMLFAAGLEWLDHRWWGHRIDPGLLWADAVLVLLAGLVSYRLLNGDLSAGPLRLRPGDKAARFGWGLVAISLWPLIVLAGNAIALGFGMAVPATPTWPHQPLLLILGESFVWFFLFGGPLNEEAGWRGFALPRLQRRFNPLAASLIIGFFWGLWHVPLHFMGAYYGGAFGALIRIQEIPRAILFTWLYNRSKGSLLVVMLFHAAVNTTSLFLPRSYIVVLILVTLLAVGVAVWEKMWRKLPAES